MIRSQQFVKTIYSNPMEVFCSEKDQEKKLFSDEVDNWSTTQLFPLQPWKEKALQEESYKCSAKRQNSSTEQRVPSIARIPSKQTPSVLQSQIDELVIKKHQQEEEFLETIHDLEMLSRMMEGPGSSILQQQIATLRADFKTKQGQCEAAIQELEAVKESELQNRKDSVQDLPLSVKQIVSALQSEILQLRANKNELLHVKKSYSRQVQQLTKDLSTQQSKLSQLSLELDRLRNAAAEDYSQEGFETVVSDVGNQVHIAHWQKSGAQARAEKMYQELLVQLQKRDQKAAETKQRLQAKVDTATALIQQREDEKQKIVESYNRISEKLEKLQAENSLQAEAFSKRIQEHSMELQRHESFRIKSTKQIEKLKSVETEASTARAKVLQLELEKKQLNTKLMSIVQDSVELEEIIKAQAEYLMDFKEHHQRAMQINKKLQAKCEESFALVDKLRAEKQKLFDLNKASAKKIASLENDLVGHKSKRMDLTKLQMEQDELFARTEQASKVNDDVASSQAKIAALQREKEVLQSTINSCADRMAAQEQFLTGLSLCSSEEIQKQEKQQELPSTTNERCQEQLNEVNADLLKLQEQRDAATKRISSIENEVTQLQSTITTLQEEQYMVQEAKTLVLERVTMAITEEETPLQEGDPIDQTQQQNHESSKTELSI